MDGERSDEVTIRPAVEADVAAVIALDERNTGMAKPEYWHDRFQRFGGRDNRFFLVIDGDHGAHLVDAGSAKIIADGLEKA